MLAIDDFAAFWKLVDHIPAEELAQSQEDIIPAEGLAQSQEDMSVS